jgi:hypothetical protein
MQVGFERSSNPTDRCRICPAKEILSKMTGEKKETKITWK